MVVAMVVVMPMETNLALMVVAMVMAMVVAMETNLALTGMSLVSVLVSLPATLLGQLTMVWCVMIVPISPPQCNGSNRNLPACLQPINGASKMVLRNIFMA